MPGTLLWGEIQQGKPALCSWSLYYNRCEENKHICDIVSRGQLVL